MIKNGILLLVYSSKFTKPLKIIVNKNQILGEAFIQNGNFCEHRAFVSPDLLESLRSVYGIYLGIDFYFPDDIEEDYIN